MVAAKIFVCNHCRGTFPVQDDEEWNEEKALAEAEKNFGKEIPLEERAILCDDCYEEFMSWYKRNEN